MRVRLDAAAKAAPYVHPRLSQIEQTGKDGGPQRMIVTWEGRGSPISAGDQHSRIAGKNCRGGTDGRGETANSKQPRGSFTLQ
jgi:hypothetical protein